MKVGDSVMVLDYTDPWDRIGLVLGFHDSMVLVFWGEEFPCEEEYYEFLVVV